MTSASYTTNNDDAGTHTVTVTVSDGSLSDSQDVIITVIDVDIISPSTPTSLQATVVSTSQIDLSWNASTDNVEVTGYRIYRDGIQVADVSSTTYQDTGLSTFTTYVYTVSAYDAASNESELSTASQATTTGDTIPPTMSSVNTFSDTEVTIAFSESVEQVSAETVANYTIDQGITVSAASLGTDLQTVTLTTSTLSEGITYTLTVNNIKDRSSVPNTIASNTQNTFTFTSDLVAYWKLDETSGQAINDSSGNNNGNLGGDNTAESTDPTRVAGNYGNGLQFDGTNDLVTISNSSNLNNITSFTYTVWIHPTSFGGGGYGRIFSKESTSGFDDVYFLVNSFSGSTFGMGISNSAGTEFGTLANANSITLNTWQHVVVTYDDSGDRKAHLYINGNEVTYQSQETVTGTLKLTTNPIILGNRISGNRSFQGTIDEVKIYNRALSATEVQNDFNSQPVDTMQPSTPANLQATASYNTSMDLSWNASTDNVGVTGYRVYRDGIQVADVSSTTYQDTGLTKDTTYIYSVSAYDAAGNESSQSTPLVSNTKSPERPTGMRIVGT